MKALLTVLAFALLGFLIALSIHSPVMEYLSDGGLTRWQPLGSPPGGAKRLVGFSSGGDSDIGIFVEAVSGDYYRWQPSAQQKWEQTQPFQSAWSDHLVCVEPLPPRSPLPPGSVVSCAETRTWEWLLDRNRFVLLTDGTVWKLHQHVSFFISLRLFGGGCLSGGLVGLLTVWAMTARLQRRMLASAAK